MGAGRKEVITITKTYPNGSAITRKRFVSLDSNGAVNHSGDGVEIKGVSQETVAITGQGVSVALINAGNISQVEASTLMAAAAQVASDSVGRAKTSASADIEVGQADEGASVTGQYAIVHLTTAGKATA